MKSDRLAHIHHSTFNQAMKLVAAAKVRRAQEAVISSRPFSENLVKVLFGINQRIKDEDVDSPLCAVRPVKSVLLVVITGVSLLFKELDLQDLTTHS